MKNILRHGQHKDESAMEYLRRAVNNLDYELCDTTDALPSVGALLEFFELWHTYDTDLSSGVMEAIEEGANPEPWNAFVRKYKLRGWRTFRRRKAA